MGAPGSARTEEESSLLGDADLPSNILPLSEKVEGREAREARRHEPKEKTKKKKKKNELKEQQKEEKKKGGKRKKTRKDTKKKEEKNKRRRKKLRKSAARQAAGGDWSSCGTSGVNDTCLLNAVNSLNFEKNQIQNFFKQKARLENQNKVTGNKKKKKKKKKGGEKKKKKKKKKKS